MGLRWLSKAVKKVTRPVGEFFEGAAKTIKFLVAPSAVMGRIDPGGKLASLLIGPRGGEIARNQNKGSRDESLLGSEDYAQSRTPDQYSARQGQAFERGQYASGTPESRTMIGSNTQEEEMLGLMEDRRRRGTLLGE